MFALINEIFLFSREALLLLQEIKLLRTSDKSLPYNLTYDMRWTYNKKTFELIYLIYH